MGAGYIAAITDRHNRRVISVPAILPLASIIQGEMAIQMTSVPGVHNNVNLYFPGRDLISASQGGIFNPTSP
ncbi:hypothetical protein [Pantoea sp. PGP6]